ncbi:MAG TPA: hypothetical protein VKF37_16245 [Chloroflexota bacterium]|nr:hypothetical protein [Chloroflexota bacterium]
MADWTPRRRRLDWDACPGGYDEQGLYALSTRNARATWDYYGIGGRWDGRMLGLAPLLDAEGRPCETLERNACPVQELRHDWVPYAVVSQSSWLARGTMGFWGVSHGDLSEQEWKGRYTEFLSAHPAHWAVSLDCHI